MMVLVYITTSNEEEAFEIGKKLVEERLAACSNVIKDMKSIYWWENNLEEDNEAILIVKTLKENIDKVIDMVKEIHSYDNPCIIAIPVLKASNSYLEWVKEETNHN